MTPARYQLEKLEEIPAGKRYQVETWNNNQKKSYFIRCSRTRYQEKNAPTTYVFLFYGTEKAKKARL